MTTKRDEVSRYLTVTPPSWNFCASKKMSNAAQSEAIMRTMEWYGEEGVATGEGLCCCEGCGEGSWSVGWARSSAETSDCTVTLKNYGATRDGVRYGVCSTKMQRCISDAPPHTPHAHHVHARSHVVHVRHQKKNDHVRVCGMNSSSQLTVGRVCSVSA